MENQLDEQLSLKIIAEAIENTKSNFKDNGFFYLLWGWLVLFASLLEYKPDSIYFNTLSLGWMANPDDGRRGSLRYLWLSSW